MSHKMRIRKGDTVHMLSGKDRGKEGRVIEARPREQRVVVENLNIQKRHTRPRPIRDANRMGGTQMTPGGRIENRIFLPSNDTAGSEIAAPVKFVIGVTTPSGEMGESL